MEIHLIVNATVTVMPNNSIVLLLSLQINEVLENYHDLWIACDGQTDGQTDSSLIII